MLAFWIYSIFGILALLSFRFFVMLAFWKLCMFRNCAFSYLCHFDVFDLLFSNCWIVAFLEFCIFDLLTCFAISHVSISHLCIFGILRLFGFGHFWHVDIWWHFGILFFFLHFGALCIFGIWAFLTFRHFPFLAFWTFEHFSYFVCLVMLAFWILWMFSNCAFSHLCCFNVSDFPLYFYVFRCFHFEHSACSTCRQFWQLAILQFVNFGIWGIFCISFFLNNSKPNHEVEGA